VKERLWLAKLLLICWLKLNEKLFVLPASDMGVKPGVLFTPPAVLTHVSPHVTSRLSDGLVGDWTTILTTTLILVDSGLETIAVQL
jgi:hypothetical protein